MKNGQFKGDKSTAERKTLNQLLYSAKANVHKPTEALGQGQQHGLSRDIWSYSFLNKKIIRND